MLYSRVYYYNHTPGYSDFFKGFGLVLGPLVASNLLTNCPKYVDKFSEIYIIGLSTSIFYSIYLYNNNKYIGGFLNDFKNSFFITMCGSLFYFHSSISL